MEKRLIKVGESLAVTFNEKLLLKQGMKIGDIVEVFISPIKIKKKP